MKGKIVNAKIVIFFFVYKSSIYHAIFMKFHNLQLSNIIFECNTEIIGKLLRNIKGFKGDLYLYRIFIGKFRIT